MNSSSGLELSKDAENEIRVTGEKAADRTFSPYLSFSVVLKTFFLLFLAAITMVFVLLLGMRTANASTQIDTAKSEFTEEEISAAQGVESLMIGQMIDVMRKTVPENEYVPKSQAERVFESLLDNEYSRIMSENGTLGVSSLVLAEIKGKR